MSRLDIYRALLAKPNDHADQEKRGYRARWTGASAKVRLLPVRTLDQWKKRWSA